MRIYLFLFIYLLIVTAPPVPPVAVPDPTSSDPVVLLLDDPELSTSMPDTPVVPAFAVAIVTAPLELAQHRLS